MENCGEFAEAFAGAEGGNAPPDALERMNSEVDRLILLEKFIQDTEEALKAAKSAATEIKQRTLPDIMAEVRTDEIVRDGYKLKMTNFVSGSLPNEAERPGEHARAVDYLETLPGGEGLLRTTITIELGKGQANVARAIVEDIVEQYGVQPKIKHGVPHMTLQAFAREKIANSEAIDTDILGLYCGTAVKVTQIKEKAKK